MPNDGKKKLWENKQEARPGHQDKGGKQHVVEGTTVSLFAKQSVGSGSTTTEWVITDESQGGGDVREAVDLPSRKNVVLADVPDDRANYSYKYRIAVDGRNQPGYAEYTVWPQRLGFEFEYDKTSASDTSGLNTGDPVVGMNFWLVRDGQKLNRLWTSEAGGVCEVNVTPGAEISILPESPWSVTDPADQAGLPRKRKYKVSQAAWTAKIISHDGLGTTAAAANVHRQYINLPRHFANHKGSLVKLTLGPDILANGKQNEVVYVKVTFDAANASRTDPVPGVWTTSDAGSALRPGSGPLQPDGATERVFETEVSLPNDGQAAELYVQMGYAGGDACKIEVGATPNYGDHTVYAQNWRKLNVAMIHGDPTPGPNQVSTSSVLRADNAAGFSAAQLATMVTEFEGLFIEFVESRTEYYSPADLGNAQGQRAMIQDGPYMGRGVADKCVIVGFDELDRLAQAKRAPSGIDTWLCLWFDYLADSADITQQSGILDAGNPTETYTLPGHQGLFEYDPVTTELSCTRINHIAVGYDDGGGWQPMTTPSANAAFEANRVALSNWQTINAPPLATIHDFIDFDNWQQFTIKAPAAHLINNGVHLAIHVNVDFDLSEFTCNGCAVGGNLWMNTFINNYADNGLLGVVLHEMGHNMGMAYGLKGIGSVRSMADAYNTAVGAGRAPTMNELFALGGRQSNNQIPGMPFPQKVPTGYYYLGHDHTGGHCAHGVSAADRQGNSYGGKNGDCIMFGESDMNSAAPRSFCDDCKKYIKATDLRDIMKDW